MRRSRAAPTGKPNLVPGLVVSGPGTQLRIDPTLLLPAGFRLRETRVEGRPLTRVPVLNPPPFLTEFGERGGSSVGSFRRDRRETPHGDCHCGRDGDAALGPETQPGRKTRISCDQIASNLSDPWGPWTLAYCRLEYATTQGLAVGSGETPLCGRRGFGGIGIEKTSWVAWCGALPEAPPEGLMEEQINASPNGLRTTQGTPL